MTTRTRYPRIRSVRPLSGKRLLVAFDEGTSKLYDCSPLLSSEAFAPLANEVLFRNVQADAHGFGVIWNDQIDLAESELWLRGVTVSADGVVDE
jgi:hypothetical protein